jgi:hypothetical protein
MDYLFFQMTAINGFDAVSHYLRAGLLTNLCSTYAIDPVIGCNANFTTTRSIRSSASGQTDKQLERTRQALATDQAAQPGQAGGPKADAPADQTDPFAALHDLTDPTKAAQRRQALERASGNGRSVSPMFGRETPRERALDYLLGNDGR